MNFSIERVQSNTDKFSAYCRLRNLLWPMGEDVCEREATEIIGDSRWAVFVARLEDGSVAGFLEVKEQWALTKGCTEIASDAQIDNAISIELHKRMGYAEVERQVCFLKRLGGSLVP